MTDTTRMQTILGKFQPVQISFDTAALSPDVRAALPHLRAAMDALTRLYQHQQDPQLANTSREVSRSGSDVERQYWKFFKNPYTPLGEKESLDPRIPPLAPGGTQYPEGLTAQQFRTEVDAASPAERDALTSPYTVVRRSADGHLQAIPYEKAYERDAREVARHLQAAANELKHEPLRDFLRLRARSLVEGCYREADAAWVRLKDTPLEVVLGPFEVYADEVAGLKAYYEAMLIVTDQKRGAILADIEANIGALAGEFPTPCGSRSACGGNVPIVVGHQIYSAGEAASGVMASAFNLPNDPWVRREVGWKQVMLYNIMQAKFLHCTTPISARLVEDAGKPDFEPYFYFVLLHEISHGLGPAFRADGTQVDKCLGKFHTPIEEAKADTGSLHLLQKFSGRCGVPAFGTDSLLKSYLGGLFRSMRFGVHEAHGAANVIQFNWFKEKGIIRPARDGRFVANSHGLAEATSSLLETLCTLQASGTPEDAARFLDRYAKPGQDIIGALELVASVPTDIRPEYVLFPEP